MRYLIFLVLVTVNVFSFSVSQLTYNYIENNTVYHIERDWSSFEVIHQSYECVSEYFGVFDPVINKMWVKNDSCNGHIYKITAYEVKFGCVEGYKNNPNDVNGICVKDVPSCSMDEHLSPDGLSCECNNGLPKDNEGKCVDECAVTLEDLPLVANNITEQDCTTRFSLVTNNTKWASFGGATCCYTLRKPESDICPKPYQTLDPSTSTCVCEHDFSTPPINGDCPVPLCQKDDEHLSSDSESCVCNNGLPKVNGECQKAQCPTWWEGKFLRLQGEDLTLEICRELYPTPPYETNFISSQIQSCCYANKIYDDNNKTDEGCKDPNFYVDPIDGMCKQKPKEDVTCNLPNHYRDAGGNCVPIPCGQNQVRSGNECVDVASAEKDKDGCVFGFSLDSYGNCVPDESLGGDGYEDNRSVGWGDDNTSVNYGIDGNGTKLIDMYFSDSELSKELSNQSGELSNIFYNFLVDAGSETRQLYHIDIPFTKNCVGCKNISVQVLGYNFKADICTPLEELFSYMRPLLWFVFLVTLMYNFLYKGL